MVVFCGTFVCTGKGYVERGTSLALLEREGALFRACFARLSKVVVFCGTFGCTGKGYVERETSLASLEREGGTLQGLLCSPLKSGGFGGTFVCTGKGYVGRELLLLCSRERGYLFRACFARLSKVVVLVALLGALVRGI